MTRLYALIACLPLLLGGCAVASVTASVVGAAVSVAGSAVGATIDVAGSAAGGAVDLMTDDDDDDDGDDERAEDNESRGPETAAADTIDEPAEPETADDQDPVPFGNRARGRAD